MELKDWILLLVPILFNGIIVFALQKIFEKKQIVRTIEFEYASILRQKIDKALELHAQATRLANEGNPDNDKMINDAIKQYVDSVLDVYYYHIQNKVIFHSLEESMEKIASLIMELTKKSQQANINAIEFSSIFNNIRDELMLLKNNCIKLKI